MRAILKLPRNVVQQIFFFLVLPGACLAGDSGPDASFSPAIIGPEQGAIQNAGCGTEIWRGGPDNGETRLVKTAVAVSDYAVNSMIRVSWDQYETEQGKYCFDRMDKHFRYGIRFGQKLDIACFVTSAGAGPMIDGASCSYPLYIHEAMQASPQKDTKDPSFWDKKERWEPNFENAFFFQRYDALLKAFADYLEQPITVRGKTIQRKKVVRCIEMRHFGYWGEGAYPKRFIPSHSDYLIRFADAFIKHFPDIRIVVPTNGMTFSPIYAPLKDYHFHLLALKNKAGLCGIFRDNWGLDERLYQRIYYAANKAEKNGVKLYELLRDRWKVAPVVGEPGQVGPKGDFRPYSCLLDQVDYLHPLVIRNCNVAHGNPGIFNPDSYSIFDDPQALENFHRMYARIGFRYLFTSARVTRPAGGLQISLDWLNIGLTPTYDRWNIRYLLCDASGKEIWSALSTLDLRTLLPDAQTKPGVVDPSKATTHTDRFDNVPPAERLYLQIVDPDGISPPMALTVQGRTARGEYPLTVATATLEATAAKGDGPSLVDFGRGSTTPAPYGRRRTSVGKCGTPRIFLTANRRQSTRMKWQSCSAFPALHRATASGPLASFVSAMGAADNIARSLRGPVGMTGILQGLTQKSLEERSQYGIPCKHLPCQPPRRTGQTLPRFPTIRQETSHDSSPPSFHNPQPVGGDGDVADRRRDARRSPHACRRQVELRERFAPRQRERGDGPMGCARQTL
jgi:hypothetical protein